MAKTIYDNSKFRVEGTNAPLGTPLAKFTVGSCTEHEVLNAKECTDLANKLLQWVSSVT